MMQATDGDFDFNLSSDEERLLVQLATDVEVKDSVAGAIDSLPAPSDLRPKAGDEPQNENGASAQGGYLVKSTAPAPFLMDGGAESVSTTLKRSSDGFYKNAADNDSKATTAPVSENFEDEFDDGRSPLQKFRSYPRRPLTVSDLTSGAWCELQYWYTLSRLPGGRRTRTSAMRQGSKVHQKLEDEVHTTVEVQIMTKEDGFGLKLWNFIQGLRTLRETGLTRELEIWGVLDGNLVNGVIDCLSHENPNPEFELELSQGEYEEEMRKKTKITDYFVSEKPTEAKRTGPKVYLADVKTRGSLQKVSKSMVRPAKIQLLLYHRFLSDVAAGRLDFNKVFSRYGLDSGALFSDGFLAQMVSLQDEVAGSSWQSTGQDSNPASSPAANIPSALEYKNLTQLLRAVRQEVDLTFPQGGESVGNLLRVQYIYRDDGREIDHHDFAVSRSVLDDYLKVYMAWWRGERRASGVSAEEAFKCRFCEFAEVCTWRQDMDQKRVTQVQRRLRVADKLKEKDPGS